jgi:16S rRNA (uracil1498-N3)-methyltransferase
MSQPHERFAAAEDAAAHTFVADLDDTVEITGADGHHLQRVRRLRVGEHVTVADGLGTWRRYEIEGAESGRLLLGARGERFVEPEPLPRVSLALALTKAGALDTVVMRCTEMGVARITPIRTRRCVVRWDSAQADRAVARLRATAREAAAQSRRARLPEIGAVTELASFIGSGHATDLGRVVVADRAGAPVRALLPQNRSVDRSDEAARKEFLNSEITAVVGPEGGFDPGEVASMEHLPHIGLGPYILRSETAPIVAVALLLDMARELCREWQV